MKVVCINNSEIEGKFATLTLGKTYTVLNTHPNWNSVGLEVKNDKGQTFFYKRVRFALLSEIRGEKLERLGL